MSITDKLKKYAANDLNVLLIGAHGIGKSTMVKAVTKELGLNMSYYSASTLDPWTDVVGVPKPVDEDGPGEGFLKFYRPKQLLDAEFLFFDELNRAHPKVLNAVLEIIQFKTVNGRALPNLRMVWAAINPPGQDYDVEDLDPALLDRFHVYLQLQAEFNMPYMKTKMEEGIARALRSWWTEDMSKEQRTVVTPRRLEYIGQMIELGLDWKDALPDGSLPHGHLARKLAALKHGVDISIDINKEAILENPETFTKRAAENPSDCIKIKEVVLRFSPAEFFVVRDLLEVFPKDLLVNIGSKRWPGPRQNFYEKFIENNIDPKKYPKVYEAWSFHEFDND